MLLPLPRVLQQDSVQAPLRIEDRNGQLLYEVRQAEYGAQEYLTFDRIPQQAVTALVAIEDRKFYSHLGVRPLSIVRAFWQNFQAGKVVSGGSTITQQLVRNRLQPESRGYAYKLKEMFYAIKLETRLSKDEILESYLNSAYFGQQAYGLKAASRSFFDKQPAELSLAETSFLIGLLQSPSGYDPYLRFELAKDRQEMVLKALHDTGQIDTKPYEEALEESITLAKRRVDIKAPHFVFWVLNQLGQQAMAATSFAKDVASRQVKTTLDLELQTEVEQIVDNELSKLAEKNVTSAAVVVLDVDTGEVLSMVGSADYFDEAHDGQVNVAVSSRQPGSALKPFTYALALVQGDTAATTVADIEAQFFTQEGNPYIPRNYDYGFHGLVRYREALANSYNIPAVKVLEKVGVPRLQEFLTAAGIRTLNQKPEFYGVALTLGSGEVKLLELTQAYGIFPRGGRTLPVQYLYDSENSENLGIQKILDPKIAWLITDILSDNEARIPEFGESSALYLEGRPVAAKTGTTRNSRDNWTIGFSADYLVGVWVGNADNTPMKDTSGVTGAGPIFNAVMQAANRNVPPRAFSRPSGFIQQEICVLSGLLPTEYCPFKMQEWFVAGTEPREQDHLYVPVQLDRRNGLLAGSCEDEFIQEQVYIDFPPELEKWARENGYPSPPLEFSPLCPRNDQFPNALPTGQAGNDQGPLALGQEPLANITKPNSGDSFKLDPLIPNENEMIILEARAKSGVQTLTWFVDGEAVGTAKAPNFRMKWLPQVGKHQISVSDSENSQDSNISSIWIEIIE